MAKIVDLKQGTGNVFPRTIGEAVAVGGKLLTEAIDSKADKSDVTNIKNVLGLGQSEVSGDVSLVLTSFYSASTELGSIGVSSTNGYLVLSKPFYLAQGARLADLSGECNPLMFARCDSDTITADTTLYAYWSGYTSIDRFIDIETSGYYTVGVDDNNLSSYKIHVTEAQNQIDKLNEKVSAVDDLISGESTGTVMVAPNANDIYIGQESNPNQVVSLIGSNGIYAKSKNIVYIGTDINQIKLSPQNGIYLGHQNSNRFNHISIGTITNNNIKIGHNYNSIRIGSDYSISIGTTDVIKIGSDSKTFIGLAMANDVIIGTTYNNIKLGSDCSITIGTQDAIKIGSNGSVTFGANSGVSMGGGTSNVDIEMSSGVGMYIGYNTPNIRIGTNSTSTSSLSGKQISIMNDPESMTSFISMSTANGAIIKNGRSFEVWSPTINIGTDGSGVLNLGTDNNSVKLAGKEIYIQNDSYTGISMSTSQGVNIKGAQIVIGSGNQQIKLSSDNNLTIGYNDAIKIRNDNVILIGDANNTSGLCLGGYNVLIDSGEARILYADPYLTEISSQEVVEVYAPTIVNLVCGSSRIELYQQKTDIISKEVKIYNDMDIPDASYINMSTEHPLYMHHYNQICVDSPRVDIGFGVSTVSGIVNIGTSDVSKVNIVGTTTKIEAGSVEINTIDSFMVDDFKIITDSATDTITFLNTLTGRSLTLQLTDPTSTDTTGTTGTTSSTGLTSGTSQMTSGTTSSTSSQTTSSMTSGTTNTTSL